MLSLAYATLFAGLASVFVGALRYSRLDSGLQALFWFRVGVMAATVYAFYWALQGINNLHTNHFFAPVEFFFLLLIYRRWGLIRPSKVAFILFQLLFVGWVVFCYFQFHGWNEKPIWPTLAVSALSFYLAGSHLVRRLSAIQAGSVLTPQVIASFAIIFYYTFSFFTTMVYNVLVFGGALEVYRKIYMVHQVANILVQILFGWVFLKAQKPSTYKRTLFKTSPTDPARAGSSSGDER